MLTAHLVRIRSLYRVGVELALLPVARLRFRSKAAPENIRSVYDHFTKPHPRYKVFKNKSLGAALIDLRAFGAGEDFIESLRALGRAPAERRRAMARGYYSRLIDRNSHVDAIHEINISSVVRQGRPMDPLYVEKQLHFQTLAHFRYYGVFNQQEQLVGYCNVGDFGNFAAIDRVIGYKNGDGAMYLLIMEIAFQLITEQKLDYLMYDTLFGAQPGLRKFKQRLGFQPYRAKYAIDTD